MAQACESKTRKPVQRNSMGVQDDNALQFSTTHSRRLWSGVEFRISGGDGLPGATRLDGLDLDIVVVRSKRWPSIIRSEFDADDPPYSISAAMQQSSLCLGRPEELLELFARCALLGLHGPL